MEVRQFWRAVTNNMRMHNAISESRATVKKTALEAELSAIDSIEREQLAKFIRFATSFTAHYHDYIIFLVKEMEKREFYRQSSVKSAFDTHLPNISSRYSLLAQIDLESHTLNVAYKTALLSRSLPDMVKGINIVLALLHDFGKADTVEADLGVSEKKHHKLSAEFASRTMAKHGIPSSHAARIYSVLYWHHDDIKETKGYTTKNDETEKIEKIRRDEWFKHLSVADVKARQDEIEALSGGYYG